MDSFWNEESVVVRPFGGLAIYVTAHKEIVLIQEDPLDSGQSISIHLPHALVPAVIKALRAAAKECA